MQNSTSPLKGLGANKQPAPRNKGRKLPLTAFAFSLQYAFYHVYFRDFPGGPVGAAVRAAGASVETVSVCVLVSFAVGIACCFNNAWMQMVYRRRSLKLFLLICAFLSVFLLPLASYVWLIMALAIIGAFCAGTIMCRSLYTAMFLSLGIHPSLLVVAVYAIFQPIYLIFEFIPALRTLPMFYAVGAPMLFAGLAFFFPHEGDEMERRRVLPENKLRLGVIWPPLALIILAQVSFAFYEVVLFPQMPGQPYDQALRIIPYVVVMLILILFGRKISIRGALYTYAVISACAALAFQMDMSRAVVYMFTEPAYRFFTLFLFWLLLSSFRMYGRSQSRLKLFIAADVALGVVVIMLAQLLLPLLPSGFISEIPLFAIVVLVFLLIPKAEQVIRNMDSQGEYAESRSERDVPLPDEREDILAAIDALIHTRPAGAALTREEEKALAYLINGQPADVTAHFMDVPISRVNELTAAVIARFGCKNAHELMVKLGAAQAELVQREQMRGLIATESLSQAEMDVALMLVEGEPKREIARKLHISADELKQHEDAIRQKLNILSGVDPVIAAVVGKYKLTKRETEILSFLCKGSTNDEIADELYLSEDTVKTHVRNLLKKLPVEKRRDIPAWLETERRGVE